MGKKSKVGRQRKDKFYHLAKETGYRSRAAFKLIQLNRKFEFLQKSRVLIDLCAAPGGWMQVAKQNMPVSSVVIGVDMFPFKPLPGCITLLEDITTDKCRVSLQKELKTWKADVVLHDGAPNVGQNWLHDAYNQSCLTLSALKLATTFLREGGCFITKVFRSKDYNSLLWVFKQLFKKVHATKPQASRNESAEIFVVCQGYLAPKTPDPKFLNANYVFKDIEEVDSAVTLRIGGKKKKVKADGYPDDVTILHTRVLASEFMASDNPAIALQNAYEIFINDEYILNHASTTEEIKRCCEDIKVLGRKELRDLLTWWKVFQDEKKKLKTNDKSTDADGTDKNLDEPKDELLEEENELDEIGEQIKELEDEHRRDMKRKRKKVNKERAKLTTKMNLNMRQKDDLGPTEEMETDLFQLSHISSKKVLTELSDQKPDAIVESDEDTEGGMILKKIKYDAEKSYLDSSGIYYKTGESDEEEHDDEDDSIESDKESLGLSDNEPEEPIKKKRVTFAIESEPEPFESHPLLTDLDFRTTKDKQLSKAELWFDKDIFRDVEKEDDEDYELDKMTTVIKSMGGRIIGDKQTEMRSAVDQDDGDDDHSDIVDKIKDNECTKKRHEKDTRDNLKEKRNQMKTDTEDVLVEKPINEWDVDQGNALAEKKKQKKERRTLNDVGLALGSMMVASAKVKRDLFDGGWNRYAFNDENLPDWFVQDEERYMRKEDPVPKELTDEYKKRREEINVRPIKKVIEAKARKKKRAIRKLEKAKTKLEGVMDNPDVTSAEKARQVKQIYKKLKQPKPEVKYLIAKKHTTAKRAKRPRGLKGPYKVVDPRMKKDLRGKINKMTKSKSKTKVRKIKKTFKPKRKH